MFIDTHAHVYLSEFDADRETVLTNSLHAGVERILLPNIDAATIPLLRKCTEANPTVYKGMMGLHPGSVKEDYASQLEKIKEELYANSYIAVGEIGIDLYWDKTYFKEQLIAFGKQIEWALDLDLPIVIHARDSFQEIAEVLEGYRDTKLKGIFHCFSGDSEQMKKALSFDNFLLGIGGVLTFKNGGLDKIIHEAPLDRLVLETDSPYLAPAPNRGKRNEPAYIKIVAEKLASILELPLDLIEKTTTQNALQMFNLVSDE